MPYSYEWHIVPYQYTNFRNDIQAVFYTSKFIVGTTRSLVERTFIILTRGSKQHRSLPCRRTIMCWFIIRPRSAVVHLYSPTYIVIVNISIVKCFELHWQSWNSILWWCHKKFLLLENKAKCLSYCVQKVITFHFDTRRSVYKWNLWYKVVVYNLYFLAFVWRIFSFFVLFKNLFYINDTEDDIDLWYK